MGNFLNSFWLAKFWIHFSWGWYPCKVYKCNDTYDNEWNEVKKSVPYNKYNLLKYLFVLSYIFTSHYSCSSRLVQSLHISDHWPYISEFKSIKNHQNVDSEENCKVATKVADWKRSMKPKELLLQNRDTIINSNRWSALIHLDDTVFDPLKCNETLVQVCEDNKHPLCQDSLLPHNRKNSSYSSRNDSVNIFKKVVQTSKETDC